MLQTSQEMIDYYKKLERYLKYNHDKVKKLESIIQSMQKEMNELKEKSSVNIEKIEYKFDQLKVETLEGTLNIGLTPGDGEPIEDFVVNQTRNQQQKEQPKQPDHQPKRFTDAYPDAIFQIQDEVHLFLNEEGKPMIESIEKDLQNKLNDAYRQFMIDDVRRQIDKRIDYYANDIFQNEQNLDEVISLTIEKVKQDIESAFRSFIKNMPDQHEGGVHQ